MKHLLPKVGYICLLSFCFTVSTADAQWRFRHSGERTDAKASEQIKQKSKKYRSGQPGRSANIFKARSSQEPILTVDDGSATTAPFVVPPSTLDISTARFGKLEFSLTDAAFLEARVAQIHLIAERLDMASGKLSSLRVDVDQGEFQDFIIDSLVLSSQTDLHFDLEALLNNKTLEFVEPALAQARVIVSQSSLNHFINSQAVLERLSGTAKKRVPILSALAKQDVNFGFTFTGGDVQIDPDDRVHLLMHSKLGIGRAGMPVQLKAEARLSLENGWVNLLDTRLLTGGQPVPKDIAEKIVRRINELSKWGSVSDDIKFQFTDLQVVPQDRLVLEGTATVRRLRFVRHEEIAPEKSPAPQSDSPAVPEAKAPPSQPSELAAPQASSPTNNKTGSANDTMQEAVPLIETPTAAPEIKCTPTQSQRQ